eukprot:SM000048S16538  [mRNA]  locus=s48:251619:253443:- [translate_table: standard]
MSWRSSGRDNDSLVAQLEKNGIVSSERVAAAMRQVDRADFVQPGGGAYEDSPQLIASSWCFCSRRRWGRLTDGAGYNATISAPHMHGYCLSLLADHLQPGMRVLDVGSGSGYLTAIMALLVGEEGRVVGVEHIPELVERSLKAISKGKAGQLLENGSLSIHLADGRLGHAQDGPYHAIHVGAAAAELPQELVDQLRPGGRMVVPVGSIFQDLEVVDKEPDGTVRRHSAMGVRYVPLTARDRQLANA